MRKKRKTHEPDKTTNRSSRTWLRTPTQYARHRKETLRRHSHYSAWEKLPEFVSLLKKYKDDFIESSKNQFLSDRRYRLACKMDRRRHICRVIKQRAVDADPDVPANPWMLDPLHHPLSDYELKEGEKLIQKALRPAS